MLNSIWNAPGNSLLFTVGVSPEDRPTACWDADQAAEYIMRRMTEQIIQ